MNDEEIAMRFRNIEIELKALKAATQAILLVLKQPGDAARCLETANKALELVTGYEQVARAQNANLRT